MLFGFGLADEFLEAAGAELELEGIFFGGAGGVDEAFGVFCLEFWGGGHSAMSVKRANGERIADSVQRTDGFAHDDRVCFSSMYSGRRQKTRGPFAPLRMTAPWRVISGRWDWLAVGLVVSGWRLCV